MSSDKPKSKPPTLDDIINKAIKITQDHNAKKEKDQQRRATAAEEETERQALLAETMPLVWEVAARVLARIETLYKAGGLKATIVTTKDDGVITLRKEYPPRTARFGVAIHFDYPDSDTTAEIGLWQVIAMDTPTNLVCVIAMSDISKPKAVQTSEEFSVTPSAATEKQIEDAVLEALKRTFPGLA